MSRLTKDFNWGKEFAGENPILYRQLNETYSKTSRAVNRKVNKVTSPDTDPPADSNFNTSLEIGDVYVRTDTDTAWMMTSRTTAEAVTWTQIS